MSGSGYFAVVGDVHGHMHRMVDDLQRWEQGNAVGLDFVLQVGDFEPVRHEADLASVHVPAKYRKLGDFGDFAEGLAVFPWPLWFIGGNHEPYGYLDQRPDGFSLLDQCHYLGRAGQSTIGGLRLAWLSAIHHPEHFDAPRPEVTALQVRPRLSPDQGLPPSATGRGASAKEGGRAAHATDARQTTSANPANRAPRRMVSPKRFTYFNAGDVARLKPVSAPDLMLFHEWPEGLSASSLFKHRRGANAKAGRLGVGNPIAAELIQRCRPPWVFCGHMHEAFCGELRTGGATSQVVCLAAVGSTGSFAIMKKSDEGLRLVAMDDFVP